MPNIHASELAKLAKGKPKKLTKAQKRRASERLREARKKRWKATI